MTCAVARSCFGISEDGSRVYFVANGALSAVAGKPNLYLYESGGLPDRL